MPSVVTARQPGSSASIRKACLKNTLLLQCVLSVKMHTMKSRITLTMDPEISKRAKKIAHSRRTSVSALIEDLVRHTPISAKKAEVPFVQKWAGKFRLRHSSTPDPRLEALKKRYRLKDR